MSNAVPHRFSAALTAALIFSGPVAAQTSKAAPAARPRAVAERVAAAIASTYFDEAKARAIAEGLRRDARAGMFDRYTDPRDLATALTTRLRPFDAHFSVAWDDPVAARQVAAGPSGPVADPLDLETRTNSGVRRVEMLPGGVGLLELNYFADFDKADAPARRRVDAALALLADAHSLIVDVRDNGGGSPAMVGYLVASLVKPEAEVFNTFISRAGAESERPPVQPIQRRPDVPVYVLISGRTGSAAESFAYTLQAAKRATVVGEASGGAANPGDPVAAGDGFTVFVSSGSPRNPITGANWEGAGVQPDVRVPAAAALGRAHALALETWLKGRSAELAPDAVWTLDALRGPTTALVPAADYIGVYGEVAIETAGGALRLTRGRRPARTLRPLSADLFYDAEDPTIRVAFQRRPDGRITALEQRYAAGQVVRRVRDATPKSQGPR